MSHLSARNNITLIGMPDFGMTTAIGKSTAAALDWPFISTDQRFEDEYGPVGDFIGNHGVEVFCATEQRVVNSLITAEASVIAVAGSVLLSPESMEHLAGLGKILWVDSNLCRRRQEVIGSGLGSIASAQQIRSQQCRVIDRKAYRRYADAMFTPHPTDFAVAQAQALGAVSLVLRLI